MVYAAVALALVLIWRATRVVNFAQGAMAMFSTYVAVTAIEHGADYLEALLVALAFGFVSGAVVERVLIRPVENKPPLNAVIVTLGLLILVEAGAAMIWGGSVRSYPAHFSRTGIQFGSQRVALSPFDLYVIAVVVAVMVLLVVLFRFTSLGLRMRASAFEPEVARLLGIRVGRMLTLGWALAAVVGALAGVLVAPKVFLDPNNMDNVLVYAFTAAIVGGLDSPLGALVGGLGMGLGLSYVGGYLGYSLETVGAFVILIGVLMIRPEGIFTTTTPRRV
jgi:branched-chain amino acid transport system permease protein